MMGTEAMRRLLGSAQIIRSEHGGLALQCEETFSPKAEGEATLRSRAIVRSLQWPVMCLHATMRRAKLGNLIAEPYIEESQSWPAEELRPDPTAQTEVRIHERDGVRIRYTNELAGGGQEFGDDAIDYIERVIGPVDRAFEWCAGPGFLGYSLLGRGLCRSLCLADINPKSVAISKETMEHNGLSGRVSVVSSDCLDDIPNTEQWDLVIGNPPWSKTSTFYPTWGEPIKYLDVGLQLHRRFFRDVRKFLRPNAQLVLLESYLCTSMEDFRPLLEEYGLTVLDECSISFRDIYILRLCQAGEESGCGGR
jgi:predicted RNA methylase